MAILEEFRSLIIEMKNNKKIHYYFDRVVIKIALKWSNSCQRPIEKGRRKKEKEARRVRKKKFHPQP